MKTLFAALTVLLLIAYAIYGAGQPRDYLYSGMIRVSPNYPGVEVVGAFDLYSGPDYRWKLHVVPRLEPFDGVVILRFVGDGSGVESVYVQGFGKIELLSSSFYWREKARELGTVYSRARMVIRDHRDGSVIEFERVP